MTYRTQLSESLAVSLRAGLKGAKHITEYEGTEATSSLLRLSVEAGKASRFNTDPNLSASRFEAMCHALMHEGVAKKGADAVLVARAEGEATDAVAGVVAVQAKDGVVQVSLLAVDPARRREGLGTALMAAACEWGVRRGVGTLSVSIPTRNFEARKLCERCGGVVSEHVNEFHFWLAGAPFADPIQSEIPNAKPFLGGGELENLKGLFESRCVQTHMSFGPANEKLLEEELGVKKALLVGSGTQALEMCSFCVGGEKGVEVIMPSYTFVSTANAFVTHGATPVFVDVRRDTQNIDETKIEAAITEKTRAICVVHYAGVACEMDTIMAIAKKHNLFVVEDNAHGVFGTYKGRKLGSIGDVAALSFHYTKNIICGEGGAVLVNNASMIPKAMIAWEKGTNRFDFLQGRVDKYAWVGKGGSFVLSEIAAAVLSAQLKIRWKLIEARVKVWNTYHEALEPLERAGKLARPVVPEGVRAQRAHLLHPCAGPQ